MPLQLDDVGICPAILLPDPFEISAETFERVVRGATAAGFDAFSFWSFWPTTYGVERTRDLLGSLDATVPVVEAATQWSHGLHRAAAEAGPLVDVAARLGAPTVAACCLEPQVESWVVGVAGFRALCDAARDAGLRVCVEFLPGTGIPDLATAWRLLEASGADNGGILLDMMHWHRQQGGPDFELLEQLPGDRIHYVQICDTVTGPVRADTYMAEAMSDRRLPGQGTVDIARLLGTLERIGADPWFAYEVFNHSLAAEGIDAMARRLATCHIG